MKSKRIAEVITAKRTLGCHSNLMDHCGDISVSVLLPQNYLFIQLICNRKHVLREISGQPNYVIW